MKMADIIRELQIRLPLVTDVFNDRFDVVSAVIDPNEKITFTTSTPHDLNSGDFVNVYGVKNGLAVEQFSYDAGTATLEFKFDHGYNYDRLFEQYVEITGTNNDGKYLLLDVPDAQHLIIKYDDAPFTGSAMIVVDEGFNGPYSVVGSDTATAFTVDIRDDIFIKPKVALTGGHMSTRIRISGAADMERFNAIYTSQKLNACWLVVTPPSNTSSRDRNVPSDAIAGIAQPGAGSGPLEIRQLHLENVELYAVIPSSEEIAGRHAADIAETVRWALYNSLCVAEIPTLAKEGDAYALMPVSDSYYAYLGDDTTYTHQYVFERSVYMTASDVAKPRDQTAPFRGLDLQLLPCEHNEG